MKEDNKSNIIQIKNPKTGKYIKVDKSRGFIISTKKSPGPYKDIPIVIKPKKEYDIL